MTIVRQNAASCSRVPQLSKLLLTAEVDMEAGRLRGAGTGREMDMGMEVGEGMAMEVKGMVKVKEEDMAMEEAIKQAHKAHGLRMGQAPGHDPSEYESI